jgi:D-hexose-6-phosphate mutarotase
LFLVAAPPVSLINRHPRIWARGRDAGTSGSDVFATFLLRDSAATRAMWDFPFELRYTVTLEADTLTTTLSVENTGLLDFTFTALLHTYLRARDAAAVTVSGLAGLSYTDKVRQGAAGMENRETVPITEYIDRLVLRCERVAVNCYF